ncbi:MAG: RNA-binding S4 domain-containing protein [Pseudomonadota bacterium]
MSDGAADGDAAGAQRLDKWLWFARVVKTRSLATALVQQGRVRVNRVKVAKPSQALKPGDVVTVTAHRRLRILKVVQPGARRGPAPEAQQLYEDLTPEPEAKPADVRAVATSLPRREPGAGRPTKRDRRAVESLRRRSDEAD